MDNLNIKNRLLGGRTRKVDISFHRNGRIDISARISNLLDLEAGDVIDVASDGQEYYLYVRQRPHGGFIGKHTAQCYPSNKHGRNFRAYSKKLCDAVLAISGGDCARIAAGTYKEFENIGKSVIIIPQMNFNYE